MKPHGSFFIGLTALAAMLVAMPASALARRPQEREDPYEGLDQQDYKKNKNKDKNKTRTAPGRGAEKECACEEPPADDETDDEADASARTAADPAARHAARAACA
jgi:hypothetical protein